MDNFLLPMLGAFIGVEIGELLWYLIFEPIFIKISKSIRYFSKNVIK